MNPLRPVLCLITDRRRLGAAWEEALVERVRAAGQAGVHLIQVRERDLDGGALARLVERCVDAVRGTQARVLVNDRLDVALAAGAHGVHLRGDSIDAARARRIVPAGFLIGRSVHGLEAPVLAGADGSLDYLMFGAVFDTASKPGVVAAGLDRLARVSAATVVPVLAVGGISAANAAGVGRAGGSGIAAIGLFADGAVDAMPALVAQISAAFDTPERVP
jgi:thiamine-phosphate diphosphorylase